MLLPIDAAGLKLIQSFEGLHDGNKRTPILEPEMDPIGIWTGGWGYALFDGKRPLKGTKDRIRAEALWLQMFPHGCTLADADALLAETVAKTTEKLAPLVKVSLNQAQSNALTSLAYNVGIGLKDGRKGDLADSSLLAALNAGNFVKAADHFRDWVYAGGSRLKGLERRREAERAVFLGGA